MRTCLNIQSGSKKMEKVNKNDKKGSRIVVYIKVCMHEVKI